MLNTKPPSMSWQRSAFNEVNDWAPFIYKILLLAISKLSYHDYTWTRHWFCLQQNMFPKVQIRLYRRVNRTLRGMLLGQKIVYRFDESWETRMSVSIPMPWHNRYECEKSPAGKWNWKMSMNYDWKFETLYISRRLDYSPVTTTCIVVFHTKSEKWVVLWYT